MGGNVLNKMAHFIIPNELAAIYHVTAGFVPDGTQLDDTEKDFFVDTVKKLSTVYFTKVIDFCLMDNNFHLIVQMMSGSRYSDDDITRRYRILHDNPNIEPFSSQISALKRKWSIISEFVKEIKVRFSLFYNERHPGEELKWGDLYTSTIKEK